MPSSKPLIPKLAALAIGLVALVPWAASAAPKTVCTITVNSPDEREMFRRHLPAGDYRFVELVERGRPDWLASACEQRVTCDALIISGHFDGGTEFYTDRLDQSEYLSVEEMERASCSNSCPGVFSQLKEVYLFGCNTLKPEPRQTVSEEIVRALVRSGHSAANAAQRATALGERHAESNRDRMRHIFKDVPVIYGFSSKAPLGRYAGPVLDRWFQSLPAGQVGSGQVSPKLLELFGPVSMTVTSGLSGAEPQASVRQDACNFLDTRLPDAKKVAFMHDLLRRDMAEVRLLLHHIERFADAVGPAKRVVPATAKAFEAVAADDATRDRYLTFARDADDPAVRTRMMALARDIGWLTPQQEYAEFVRTISEEVARDRIGRDEVNLACTRARAAGAQAGLPLPAAGVLKTDKVAHAAAFACLGDAQAHARVVRAIASTNAEDLSIAQAYLRHRPLTDTGELRSVVTAIGRMSSPDAQVRALETLGQQRLTDSESLRELAALFAKARSVELQRAIAGILIRSDHRLLGQADLARSLKQHRLRSPDGSDVIDALIRVLQAG